MGPIACRGHLADDLIRLARAMGSLRERRVFGGELADALVRFLSAPTDSSHSGR